MAERQPSDVDRWLRRETPRIRKALESASRYFDGSDDLTVNTLEAVYAEESSFGTRLGTRGTKDPAGHFQLKASTAREYGLTVSKENDQRFDIDYASSAAARYLKDLDSRFGNTLTSTTFAVKSSRERYKFVLGAYNGGPTRVAETQRRAQKAGKHPTLWVDVETFLESDTTKKSTADQIRQYVAAVPLYEAEFARKSLAGTHIKSKEPRKRRRWCTEGRWRTINGRPVFLCD